ncbi:glycosyltransferase family 4 protein [Devosia neptuniae]|uniref:glycosyltransferase family 4 protein n=1 Tax=Devosia neptuniae TaxID=191302 RepID=UPI0022AF678A|nr:glycosyltransferase family 4 protein [Devosia neptuniae]MCZ4346755.1 glycosyltransferase family 4 protein [Devosia neptuniae]
MFAKRPHASASEVTGRRRLLLVVNVPEFFLSHRLAVALAAQRAGYDVHIATGPGDAVQSIVGYGLVHHLIPLSRSGANPIAELASLWATIRLFRHLRPNLVHLVTVKPNIYGGIAARVVGVPGVVAAVSGLGHVFKSDDAWSGILRQIAGALYRIAYGHKNLVAIFQNTDDRSSLIGLTGLPASRTFLIPGSGVDLGEYTDIPEPDGTPKVLFASRLIKSKGVIEFVEVARRLRAQGVAAQFMLAGEIDPQNPASLTSTDVDAIRAEGLVDVLGHRTDMNALISSAHIVVLPSYYGEGLPKVLIEAAACGRAVITTDHPGCRDAIQSERTGLLVPPRDIDALAQAILSLIFDPLRRRKLGAAGRLFAESEFSIESVVEAHLRIYDGVVSGEF